jgi:hypothetical protein
MTATLIRTVLAKSNRATLRTGTSSVGGPRDRYSMPRFGFGRGGWLVGDRSQASPYESSTAHLCADVSISWMPLSHLCALVNSSEGRVSELDKEGE